MLPSAENKALTQGWTIFIVLMSIAAVGVVAGSIAALFT